MLPDAGVVKVLPKRTAIPITNGTGLMNAFNVCSAEGVPTSQGAKNLVLPMLKMSNPCVQERLQPCSGIDNWESTAIKELSTFAELASRGSLELAAGTASAAHSMTTVGIEKMCRAPVLPRLLAPC